MNLDDRLWPQRSGKYLIGRMEHTTNSIRTVWNSEIKTQIPNPELKTIISLALTPAHAQKLLGPQT